jgi:hypothetical protein
VTHLESVLLSLWYSSDISRTLNSVLVTLWEMRPKKKSENAFIMAEEEKGKWDVYAV